MEPPGQFLQVRLGLTSAEFAAVYLTPLLSALVGILFIVVGLLTSPAPAPVAIAIGSGVIGLSMVLVVLEVRARPVASLDLDERGLRYSRLRLPALRVQWDELAGVQICVDAKRGRTFNTEHYVWLELIEPAESPLRVRHPEVDEYSAPSDEQVGGARLMAGMGQARARRLDADLQATCSCYRGIVRRTVLPVRASLLGARSSRA